MTGNRLISTSLFALALLGSGMLHPDSAPAATVDLEQIMAHSSWMGNGPQRAWWSLDAKSIWFSRSRMPDADHFVDGQDWINIDLKGRELGGADEAERSAVDPADPRWSPDRRRALYEHHGDLFLRERGGKLRQLTRTSARESSPAWSADGRSVSYTRDGAILRRNLRTGFEEELATWEFEDAPEADPEEGYLDERQEKLFSIVRKWKAQEDHRRSQTPRVAAADPRRVNPTFWLGKGQELVDSSLSPDGSWIFLLSSSSSLDEGRRDQMPNYISEDGYITVENLRPKVGTGELYGEELWALDLVAGEARQVDLTQLPAVEIDRMSAFRDSGETAPEGPRPVGFGGLRWNGDQLLLQGYSADNKDRWIVVLDREGNLSTAEHAHDEAWINWDFREAGWIGQGPATWWLSEINGFGQLWRSPRPGANAKCLTPGNYRVDSVQPSSDGRWLYYRANPDHPGRYEIYRVRADGSAQPEALTSLGGNCQRPVLSPDGRHLLFRHSDRTTPPELYVVETRPGRSPRRLTESRSEVFSAIDWVEPSIVEVPSTHHDRPIYSRLYMPEGTPPAGGWPAVFFVHGAGYLQNSHMGWSVYFREFMFHTLLASQGVVVLDMDYRASEGYGRDWRTAIYRHMGKPEMEDILDGRDWLVDELGVNRDRVGMYGGSYGGFLAMVALFEHPGNFAAAAALRPVTDWAHYNQGYTSNILNTPELDPEAYERSSPIEFAEGLEDPLLICAPMQDNNVFFMDVVRLTQRLIELEKEDWEVAIFPVEPHGFREPSSWLNEYRRIHKLFVEELHLEVEGR